MKDGSFVEVIDTNSKFFGRHGFITAINAEETKCNIQFSSFDIATIVADDLSKCLKEIRSITIEGKNYAVVQNDPDDVKSACTRCHFFKNSCTAPRSFNCTRSVGFGQHLEAIPPKETNCPFSFADFSHMRALTLEFVQMWMSKSDNICSRNHSDFNALPSEEDIFAYISAHWDQ